MKKLAAVLVLASFGVMPVFLLPALTVSLTVEAVNKLKLERKNQTIELSLERAVFVNISRTWGALSLGARGGVRPGWEADS